MEQQQLKRCPIGIQTFEKVIEGNYLYIDKTEYIYRMAHGASNYYFLNRPHRFGKSLLVSTMHSYFAGKKELFKGLAIEKLENEWTEYPMLHFDMSRAKHVDKEKLNEYLVWQLRGYNEKYGLTKNNDAEVNIQLADLIKRACEQTGRQVVVLIDEYDAPLLDGMHEEENLPALRNVMHNFYSPLKGCDPYLRFVFLTGVTKFSQLSMSGTLNNISNVSMLKPYAAICGITQEEMLEQMAGHIEHLAISLEMSKEDILLKLKEKYDGYHFSKACADYLQPVQPVQCFQIPKNTRNYWFSTGYAYFPDRYFCAMQTSM